jgi:hypothetical protein
LNDTAATKVRDQGRGFKATDPKETEDQSKRARNPVAIRIIHAGKSIIRSQKTNHSKAELDDAQRVI